MVFAWPDYLAAFLASVALCWVLTPQMLRLAIRTGALDAPDERKTQAGAIPYFGGPAIVAAFSVAVLGAAALSGLSGVTRELAVILGIGLLLSVMGLIDDLRGLPPSLRIAVEVGAGAGVYANGSGIQLFGPEWLNALVTIAWIVLVTNAFNLLDNMDGLSAGVAAIAAGGFFLVAVSNGQYLVAALAAALAGCATGFLRHNFHPARIYMGDAGSLFLGFVLAVLSVRLRLDGTPPVVAVFVPVLVLGVALFDTTLVVIDRLRHGRSPMQAGRDHTSHRLVWVGLPVPVAVGLIYAVALSLSWLALVQSRLSDTTTALLLSGFVLAAGSALLVLLAVVPVYTNSRQRQSMLRLVREHESEPLAPASSASGPSSGSSAAV